MKKDVVKTFADIGAKLVIPANPPRLTFASMYAPGADVSQSLRIKEYLLWVTDGTELTAQDIADNASVSFGAVSGLMSKMAKDVGLQRGKGRDGKLTYIVDHELVRQYRFRGVRGTGSQKGVPKHSEMRHRVPRGEASKPTIGQLLDTILDAVAELRARKLDLSEVNTESLFAELSRRIK